MGHRPFNDLVALVAQLRGKEGCPWDRAQDHRSLRPYLLEEAHEAIAAIDAGDPQVLADELGDLLLQVLLHSQIACEKGTFCIDTVIDLLVKKLIRRHPHVFGDAPKEMEAIRRTWEAVKQKEGRVNYPLPTILAARKLAEQLEDDRKINKADYPSSEVAEGGRILAAIAAAWKKKIDPEIALQKAIAHLSSVERKAH